MTDDPAQQAREHQLAVARALADAHRNREQRDNLVRQLRRDDPQRWTYSALADLIGCSYTLIPHILNERPP